LDPLFRLADKRIAELLTARTISSLRRKLGVVQEEVSRIERASNLCYPSYYVEPALPVSVDPQGSLAIYYARTIPRVGDRRLEIVTQLTVPLLLYAGRRTLRAVLAHEFLHYIELVRRFIKFEVVSDEIATSSFDLAQLDSLALFKPELVFADKKILEALRERFAFGLQDRKLKEQTVEKWINKGKPISRVSSEENIVRLPVEAILGMELDPTLRIKIKELERRAYGK